MLLWFCEGEDEGRGRVGVRICGRRCVGPPHAHQGTRIDTYTDTETHTHQHVVELFGEQIKGLGGGDAREEEVEADGEDEGGRLQLGGGLGGGMHVVMSIDWLID